MGDKEGPYGFWFERLHPSRGGRREYIANLVEGAEPNLGHILLATMMGEGYVPHALTPNFDDLLFDAFYFCPRSPSANATTSIGARKIKSRLHRRASLSTTPSQC